MHFDKLTFLGLLCAYLWVVGGLGWAYQHEATRRVTLSPLGKGFIILLMPFFSALSLGAAAWDRVEFYVVRPVRDHFRDKA